MGNQYFVPVWDCLEYEKTADASGCKTGNDTDASLMILFKSIQRLENCQVVLNRW